MTNTEIIEIFRLVGQLMELHEENPFKIRGYQNAVFNLEKCTQDLSILSQAELESIEGIGKGIAAKIIELNTTGSFKEFAEFTAKTPQGVIEMLNIKGIGPKKVRTIWKELSVQTKEDLLAACNENKVSQLKGFGEKTQESIKLSLQFAEAHKEKFLYAEVEKIALNLEKTLKEKLKLETVSVSGDIRRCLEVVETIQLIIGSDETEKVLDQLNKISNLEKDVKTSGPFAWRGTEKISGAKTEIKIYPRKKFAAELLIHSSSKNHLLSEGKGETILQSLRKKDFSSEKEIYESIGFPYIIPELREGLNEIELARENKLPQLVAYQDLKGILHNHSTYSDGMHTLEQMAVYCKELGFEYLGISDHSKAAFYANGMHEKRIIEQHEEIDKLNKKMAPFKILKGIESDILNDGELDYADNVLASFDFIVASVHTNLKMSEEKATARLIKAIENPYTTILGHATGRLLLKREGYPIDYKKVIEACAANNVSIEINANPRRLDMEWKWIRYALEKKIMIAINPDAHEMEGYWDMHYGVQVAKKACLTKEMTLNALTLKEIEAYFLKKKSAFLK
ncbi:MAG: DNA polymerase/3'-5' exonuclease PolX [Cytophagaceae bacterium]|nr:DNA polymerase/3'-5' exonuclease PolX [Cytophagaceae bacterium]